MENKPYYYTALQLAQRGAENIPDIYAVTSHLVYSSPATLAYNSPGAEGFGVKRAGLAVPDSVMLIVSPGCCGRNTSQISSMPQYQNRFFYLDMNETDLVTGRHLKMIPDAVSEIVESLPKRPSLVMICATCVDALLGTDWDRVARAAEKKSGVNPAILIVLLLAAGGGAAWYFLKVKGKAKPKTKGDTDLNDYDYGSEEDEEYEFEKYEPGEEEISSEEGEN